MKINPEVLRIGIQDIAFGATDEQIDDLLRRAAATESLSKTKVQPKQTSISCLDLMANFAEARACVFKADALHDPDVLMLRALSERQRAAVLNIAESSEICTPWDGVISTEILILPPIGANSPKEISIASLKASRSPFSRLAPWFARTALRISMEYRVQPQYAFGFLLLDSYWRLLPWVSVEFEQFGEGAQNARIYMDIDSMATDGEVIEALNLARRTIGSASEAPAKRSLRDKTKALAFLFASLLSKGEIENENVEWLELLEIWNAFCEIDKRPSWAYVSKGPASTAVHQFSRDVKHALVAVRGSETKFRILGNRKRKLVNS